MELRKSIKEGISNWGRFQQILKVLAKHGFAGIVHELGIQGPLPFGSHDKKSIEEDSIPQHLRLAFQELGPTFNKLGQILSTRPDLLPPEYIEEFSKLTDRIPGFEFEEVEKILIAEFGRKGLELFEEIEEKPLAAASISQVHRAKYRDPDSGEVQEVVVKVQRPGIQEIIQSDIQILYALAKGLESIRSELKIYQLQPIVEEFQRTIYEELDFSLEAKNLDAFAKNLSHIEGVIIPKVIWPLSSKKILTMTELKGTSLAQLESFPEHVDRAHLAESTAQFFLESIFFHGLFHCDAHPGNLIINTEGRGQVGLVDFGMVGRLTSDHQEKLGRIFLSLVSRDFQNLALVYVDVAEFGRKVSISEFTKDLERLLGPNLSKPLNEINVGGMMLDSISIAKKYRIRLPRDLIMFYRSIVTLEGMGRKLDPNFKFIDFGSKFGKRILKRRFSAENITQDILKAIEGFRSLSTELPGQLKSLMYKIENDSLFPQFQKFEEGLKAFRRSNQTMALSVIFFGCVLSASIMSASTPESYLVPILWITALLIGLTALITLFRK